jgi:type IV secretory pathway VirB2 component (pilin)
MKSHRILRIAAFGLALLACATPAYAAGSGMPWEGPLEQIVDSITGPVARDPWFLDTWPRHMAKPHYFGS